MLLDHCYAFRLLLWPSISEGVLWRRAPHRPIMALPWIHLWADLVQKSIQMCRGHEYFIPTKFGEYPSSDSVTQVTLCSHTYAWTSAPPPFFHLNKKK